MKVRAQAGSRVGMGVLLGLLACGVVFPAHGMGWFRQQRVEFRNNASLQKAERALAAGDYQSAHGLLVRVLENDPGNEYAERALVQVDSQLGAWSSAFSRSCRLLALYPEDTQLRLSKAYLATKMGCFRVASDELALVLAKESGQKVRETAKQMQLHVWLERARVATLGGGHDDAAAFYRAYFTAGGALTPYVGLAFLDACVATGDPRAAAHVARRLRLLPDADADFIARVDGCMDQLRRSVKK
jgi:tetratricopeptide (TPR) repeat protein